MLIAHLDFETGSPVELKTAGVYRYAEHPKTRTWGFRYWIGSAHTKARIADVKQWRPGWADPVDLLEHIRYGGMVVAHNAAFERVIWNTLLRGTYGLSHWPPLLIEQQDCTLARCAALAIPNSLEIAGQVLGVQSKKDMEGHAVMMKMARPRTRLMCATCAGRGASVVWSDIEEREVRQSCMTCDGVGEVFTWWDIPELWDRNMQYCGQDVVAETDIDMVAPALSARERQVWMHDQHVNDRGVKLDLDTIRRAIAVRDLAKTKLNQEMKRLTGGAVEKCTQNARIVDWIKSLGIECTSVAKEHKEVILEAADKELDDDIEFMLGQSDVPNVVHRVLDVRRQANKTSTAKLEAMLRCVCKDGRARGLIQYHGAATGRYAGRLIQPHNLYRIDADRDGDSIKTAVDILLANHDPNDAWFMMNALVGPPMDVLAKTMRTMFIAEKGKKLIGADLSNIEGRLGAWLADETWKLQAFADYDTILTNPDGSVRKDKKGKPMRGGPDLYELSYSRSFGIPVEEVVQDQRQQGKVSELSLGYEGGVGAFLNMGKNYGLKPEKMIEPVRASVSDLDWLNMQSMFHNARDKWGLTQDEWTACKLVIGGWRGAHPRIRNSWMELKDAAIDAVSNPERVVYVLNGKGAYLSTRGFLWAQLPSGRVIAYAKPRIVMEETARIEYEDGRPDFHIDNFNVEESAMWEYIAIHGGNNDYALSNSLYLTRGISPDMRGGGRLAIRRRRRVDYDGYNGEKKRWGTFTLYGGMQFNHFDQGAARDVLVDGMFRVEAAGYPVVLHVHDEAVSEVDENFGSEAEYQRLIATNSAWLQGCPLASKAWSGVRYGK